MFAMSDEGKVISPIEAISTWAMRERKSMLAGEEISKFPLLVEFDGMGGAGKSRTIGDLGSHYFQGLGLQWVTYVETNQQVRDVPKKKKKLYRQAQWEKACENLQDALETDLFIQVALFDRGVFDFILLNNLLFVDDREPMTEKECRAAMDQVFEVGAGKVDILFVYINTIDASLKGKMMPNSLSFVQSLELESCTPEETYVRFELAQRIYRDFVVKDERVARSVKMVVDVDIEKSKYRFSEVFERVVATICLHLVFKAWENLLLAKFGKELGNLENEKRILEFATKLNAPLAHLREKMTRIGTKESSEIPPGSTIAIMLEEYHKRPLVIAQLGNVRVIAEKLFGSPPKYRVEY